MYKEINQVHKPEAYLTVNINKKSFTSFTKLRKCALCNSGDIEDKYHVTLVCEEFADARKKYFKKNIFIEDQVWRILWN